VGKTLVLEIGLDRVPWVVRLDLHNGPLCVTTLSTAGILVVCSLRRHRNSATVGRRQTTPKACSV
jgi:hypothetical protein